MAEVFTSIATKPQKGGRGGRLGSGERRDSDFSCRCGSADETLQSQRFNTFASLSVSGNKLEFGAGPLAGLGLIQTSWAGHVHKRPGPPPGGLGQDENGPARLRERKIRKSNANDVTFRPIRCVRH